MYYIKLCLLIVGIITLLHGCSKETTILPTFPQNRIIQKASSDHLILLKQSIGELYLGDDLPVAGLNSAITQSLNYLRRIPSDQKFMYGNIEYTAEELRQSFHFFQTLIASNPDQNEFIKALEANFHMFQSSANPGDQVLYTGYYEPLFKGSLKETKIFNVPVYRKPDILKVLELGRFRETLKDRTIVYRRVNGKMVPFFNREQIMSKGVLSGKNLEIAWLKDPIDLFFMQVQGSGMIELPSGERIKLSYNGANGQKYSSIGKLLIDEGKMELEEISMESIRKYLNDYPEERDRILYHNKSYTFLTIANANENPRGNINVPLTPLRSIATDASIFPKGSLAYITTEVPEFDAQWNYKGKKKIFRFVLNQDTGGAIKGTGRVDLFWGAGKRAEKSAGKLRSMGRVYFLVAKKEVLSSLRSN